MSRDTVVRARIDSETKARAEEVLQAMGLSVSDKPFACCCCVVADEKRLPFAVQAPNDTTLVKAMKELDEGKGKLLR